MMRDTRRNLTRRRFISGAGAAIGGVNLLSLDASRGAKGSRLLDFARGHVEIAAADRERHALWGRLGGSAAERDSARLLARQLREPLGEVELEPHVFSTPRPNAWKVELGDGTTLKSAVPAPFDAWFDEKAVAQPLVRIRLEDDWTLARGKWGYLAARMQGAVSRNDVRTGLLYERAREAGLAGFVFSLPTPGGLWQMVPAMDKPFALLDERYPDARRPLPCYVVDRDDGRRLAEAAGGNGKLKAKVTYDPDPHREGLNVTGRLEGGGELTVLIAAHLDSFFTGAHDNGSGLATLNGLARELAAMPRSQRRADFLFAGHSGHHDAAAGLRAWVSADPARFAGIDQFFNIEHTDAQLGAEGKAAGWPERLNDSRAAYLGPAGWPELAEALPRLVRESGVMSVDPTIRLACIGDQHAVCGKLKNFCLIQAAPYYHTNHDTMDKLSEGGLRASVDFHLGLLRASGALA